MTLHKSRAFLLLLILLTPATVYGQLRPGSFSSVTVTSTVPVVTFKETDQAVDHKLKVIYVDGDIIHIAKQTDAGSNTDLITIANAGAVSILGSIRVDTATQPSYIFHDQGAAVGSKFQYVDLNGGSMRFIACDDAFSSCVVKAYLDNVGGGIFHEQNRAFGMGITQTRAYNAGDFTATGGGTWTVDSGDLTNFKYRVVGDTMWVNIGLASTSISGTVSTLTITIPGGATSQETAGGFCGLGDNSSTFALGLMTATATLNTLTVVKVDGSNFTASTNNTKVTCTIHFKVSGI